MTGKYPISGTLRSKRTGDNCWEVEFSVSNLGYNQKNVVEETLDKLLTNMRKADEKERKE